MKTIVMAALALAAGLLIACSENMTEGCLITHVNGVELKPAVPFPADSEPVAMNPGYSYQVGCAREIRDFSAGEIISEDQKILRIASMPADTELEIRPNERDALYRGRPSPYSANVWSGFAAASNSMTPTNWLGVWIVMALAVIAGIAALYMGRRSGEQETETAAERF